MHFQAPGQGFIPSASNIARVGQNRMYAPYMTVCMVISLPKIPYIHRIYTVYIWFWPTLNIARTYYTLVAAHVDQSTCLQP